MSMFDPDDLPVTMMQRAAQRGAVLASGRGSNLRALLEAAREGRLPCASIVLVVSDNPDAKALEVAAEFGVEAVVVDRRAQEDRAGFESELARVLEERRIKFLVLAGFMRVLSGEFVARFPEAILNIHPSLLPAFPGLDPQRQAIRHGARLSGFTVHFVDASVDGGPIILQKSVPVFEGDSVADLSDRILAEEHKLLPYAVDLFTQGRLSVDGRRVRIRPGETAFPEVEERLSSQYFPVLLATGNAHKVEEIKAILRGLPLQYLTLDDFPGMTVPEESADDYLGNARIKARTWAARTKMWVISDDSGLEVKALGGRPGVHSSRYAESNKERIGKLLREMDSIEDSQRAARFVCVAVLRGPAGQEYATEGTLEGSIARQPAGEHGFGYDPIFVPEGHGGKHLAELDATVKNRISHRARAFFLLREFLERLARGELR